MRRVFVIVGLAFAIILLIVFFIVIKPFGLAENRGADPGPEAVESFFVEYIAALNENSARAIGKLIGRPAESQDINESLKLFGGRNLQIVDISVLQEFPYIYRAYITAHADDGTTVEMYQVVEWTGERWSVGSLFTGPPPPR